MPHEPDGKWVTKCLSIGFPLPTFLCAGYSVKLIYLINNNIEASRGAAAQSVTVKPTGCGFDRGDEIFT